MGVYGSRAGTKIVKKGVRFYAEYPSCAPFIQFVDVLHGLDFCSNAPLNANKILSRNRIAARTEPVNFQPLRIRAELAGSE